MAKKDKKSQEKKEKIKLKKEKQKLKSVKKKKKNGTISDEDFDTICMYYEILNKKDKYGHININTTSNNTFVECEKPGPRGNFSLTFINDEEFLFFGGEYNDNNNLVVYNDLFKYNVTKNVWKYYFTISKKPKPRCAHQAVYFNKKLFIFGGELCTNSQFFHYNDFWSFDLKSNTFEEIETKNKKDEKPSPRSGHRMILWKNCLVMFGGFFDNGKSVDYFNDLYLYIISSNKWINLTNVYMDSLFRSFTQNSLSISSNSTQTLEESSNKNKRGNESNSKNNVSPKESNSIALKGKFLKNIGIDSYIPSKRSSVALFTDAKHEKIFIYGGYCSLKDSLKSGTGKYYNDTWVVQVNIANEYNPMVNFKKLKRSVFHPCDRVGFSICVFKNNMVLFGGVYDKPEENNNHTTTNNAKKKGTTGGAGTSEEEPVNAKSIFFNDLYLFDMNKERWSYLSLKNREVKSEGVKGKEETKEKMNKHGLKESTSDFTQNKRAKQEEKKSSANSSDIEVDSDTEYYSNVFVYFDEKGNKRTMRIEKEDTEKKEDHELENEKNEKTDATSVISTPYETTYNKNNPFSQEALEISNEILPNQTAFVHTEQSIMSTLSYDGSDFQIDPILEECIPEEKNVEMMMKTCETKEKTEKEIDHIKHKDCIHSDDESKKSEEHKQKFIISDIEPIGRINGQVFIVQKNLYLYGGIYEYKDNEIMLNDFWKINIFKREKWELLDRGNLDHIYVEEPSDSDSSDSNLDISEMNDKTKNEKEMEDLIISNKIKKLEQKLKEEDCGLAFNVKENLNEFFLRTKVHWLKQLSMKAAIRDTKEIRKEAFLLCEKKYNTLKKHYKKIEKYKELLENEESEDNISDSSSLTDEQ